MADISSRFLVVFVFDKLKIQHLRQQYYKSWGGAAKLCPLVMFVQRLDGLLLFIVSYEIILL